MPRNSPEWQHRTWRDAFTAATSGHKRSGKGINVTRVRWFGKTASERSEYASKEEFASVFESEEAGLRRLALLLTTDSESAKRCLIQAFRECIASGSVSKEWVSSWTRRMVIRNAISLVMGLGGQSFVNTNEVEDSGSTTFSVDDPLNAIAGSEAIRGLPEFERFVFIICVLERYSIHDCALLLGKSPREVNEARHRVGNRLGQIDDRGKSSKRFAIG